MVISVTFKGIGAAEAKTLKLNQDKNTKMVPQNVHILYLHPFAFVFITEFTYWSQGFTLKANDGPRHMFLILHRRSDYIS